MRIQVGERELAVTVSIGVETFKPGDDVKSLLKRADQALYAAKNSGRNRVITYSGMLTFNVDDLLWVDGPPSAGRANAA